MIKKYFENLSIHKLGLISSYISSAIIFMFAVLIINQEYHVYEEKLISINKEYKESTKEKQEILNNTKIEHKKKIMRYIVGVGGVGMFMFFTIYLLLRVVSYLIENELELFIKRLKTSTTEYKKISHEGFNFSESRSLISNTNELIDHIQLSHNELLLLNKTLEEKVKDKTKKLQELVSSQDQFIKKSIHEVNTPLSIILTNIDLLKMENIQNKKITNIESASKIINNIFTDLSFIVKKDRIEYPKEKIDFSMFLKERIEYFTEVANANGLVFITNIQNDIKIDFNPTKLQRIVDNNLSNSIKYSYDNMAIFILLKKEDTQVIFSIKTISRKIKNIDKIFDDYYREDDIKGGFGIGLNIVKEICDENMVTIEIKSNDEDTQFIYRFKI